MVIKNFIRMNIKIIANMKMLIVWILITSLYLAPKTLNASVTEGLLINPTTLDIISNNKIIGKTELPAGSKVNILDQTKEKIKIASSPITQAWVDKSSVKLSSSQNPQVSGAEPSLTEESKQNHNDTAKVSSEDSESDLGNLEDQETPKESGTIFNSSELGAEKELKLNSSGNPPSYKEVNEVAGWELFSEGKTLWEENAEEVSKRINLGLRSKTSNEASWQKGAYYKKYDFFQTRLTDRFLLAHAKAGANFETFEGYYPAELKITFANKGDYTEDTPAEAKEKLSKQFPGKHINFVAAQQAHKIKEVIPEQTKQLEQTLTKLFGKPGKTKVLQYTPGIEESGKAWEWNNHIFFVVSIPEEFLALRIIPPERFNPDYWQKRVAETQKIKKSRIVDLGQGVRILKDVPFVNQGPRGYCVPASFERLLRYHGIYLPQDLLATGATGGADKDEVMGTHPNRRGGGTESILIHEKLKRGLLSKGAKLKYITAVEVGNIYEIVKKSIDAGNPVLWSRNGHLNIIVGYDPITKNIAESNTDLKEENKQKQIYKDKNNNLLTSAKWIDPETKKFKDMTLIIFEGES
jgi:hypothetical protein